MLAVVAAIAVAVIRLTDADLEPPISLNAIVAALGALAVLLILYRIVDPPGGGSGFEGVEVDTTLKLGIFLSLVAGAASATSAAIRLAKAMIVIIGLTQTAVGKSEASAT